MNAARYVKIALFFLIFTGAGIIYILMSSDGINGFNSYSYEAILADATGLSTRTRIYLAGVIVGKVEDIQLVGNEAKLSVSFLRNIQIGSGAYLARKSSSLLGTSILALEPGPGNLPVIPPGGMIRAGLDAADMNAMMGTVQDIGSVLTQILDEFQRTQMALITVFLESAGSIVSRIDARTDDELDKVSRILDAVALITERTEALLSLNDVNITGSMTDVYGAVADIRAITSEIRAGQGNIGRAIYGDDLYETILTAADNTARAVDKLAQALDNVNSLARNVDGVVTNAGQIVDRALGLGIQIDSNARYNFIAGNASASASIRLVPDSKDRWYRIGVSSVPDGISRITNRVVIDAVTGTTLSNETTTETTFSIGIDVELARRFGMFTFRGGLYESTAGFGVDFQPWRWISLSTDLFGFKSGQVPNLRGSLVFYPFFDPDSGKPWNWLYLYGGINNALSGSRDYFIGGGLRFADREVKGLVGLIPALN